MHIGKTLSVDLGYLIDNKILTHSRNREEYEQNPTGSLGNLMVFDPVIDVRIDKMARRV